jgi:GGDEF domain-containing protein
MMNHIFKDILDSLDSYIVVLSKDGDIVYSNKNWDLLIQQLYLPKTTNENNNYFVCSTLLQTQDNGFREECTRAIKLLLDKNKAKFSLQHHINILNSNMWLDVTASLLEADQTQYVLLNHTDISDKKIDRQRIAELTVLDEKTGLANEKCFSEFLINEWHRALRTQSKIALFSAQLNKSDIVDTDIIKVAQVFLDHARRASDCAGTLEQNQFALVLGEQGSLSYEEVANSIAKKVADLELYSTKGCLIELNIGMSSTTPTLIDRPEMLFKSSSLALAKAKQTKQTIQCRHPAICMEETLLFSA